MSGVVDLDPYADSFLADPYPGYERMRQVGPAFRLDKYDCWCMARHKEVQAALQDWRTYSSARGVGHLDFAEGKPWRLPSILIEVDPPLHTSMRAVVDRIVAPQNLRRLREPFAREAAALVDRLVAQGRFDGIKDLAEIYPLKVFPDALGIDSEGRENLLPYADMVFNTFGPINERFAASIANSETVVSWIVAKCQREALAPGGWGAQLYELADAGEISAEDAGRFVRAFLSAGLDTTVVALGSALWCIAQNPDEWRKVRANRTLVRTVFEETVRLETPIQSLFRTTTREVDVDGIRIGEGEKVLLLLGSANRDHAQFNEPERFDLARTLQGHVGFGFGIHACVGQVIARLEAECLLTALADRVAGIELAGPPVRRFNNTVRGLASLPLMVQRA